MNTLYWAVVSGCPEQAGLAGTDFPGEHEEPGVLLDAVHEVCHWVRSKRSATPLRLRSYDSRRGVKRRSRTSPTSHGARVSRDHRTLPFHNNVAGGPCVDERPAPVFVSRCARRVAFDNVALTSHCAIRSLITVFAAF